MAKKALGKGLGALLATQDTGPIQENKNDVNELLISSIYPNELQPRKHFDEERLNELAESIKENGLIQPIVVTKKDEVKYEIIVGERRWRACQIIGLKKIPALIKEASNYEMLELALVENIQRHDLNSIEEAVSYKELIDNLNLTQEQLSSKIGKSRTAIANTLRLLKLPDSIQKEIIQNTLSEGHGRSLLSLKNPDHIEVVKDKIIDEGMSVRQTEKLIQDINELGINILSNDEDIEDTESDVIEVLENSDEIEENKGLDEQLVHEYQNSLAEHFQCNVKVKSKKNNEGGKIEINYRNVNELKRIIKEVLNLS